MGWQTASVRTLNRAQKVAVLAALGFVLWVFGNYLHIALFDSGFISYAPADGTDWTLIWNQAVQLGIWLILAAVWLGVAIRVLRVDSGNLEERP